MVEKEKITLSVIRDLKQGSPEAFEQVYLHYQKPITYFLAKLTGSDEEALELTQLVFVKVWEKRAQINPDKNIKYYLYTIAKNSALKRLYEKQRYYKGEIGEFSERLESQENTVEGLEMQEIRLLVQVIVNRMPKMRQQVFQLYSEGLKNEEIAKKLGISTESAAQHLSRARKNIREVLDFVVMCLVI